ncbi:Retrovirus-related Pol polyprotein from transposon TNT 1-94 [Nymphaea thermarum]|nr:Retrovirus-related Pol polyprotein from transposon TNT 1-94 [Nymphaea thermarum]
MVCGAWHLSLVNAAASGVGISNSHMASVPVKYFSVQLAFLLSVISPRLLHHYRNLLSMPWPSTSSDVSATDQPVPPTGIPCCSHKAESEPFAEIVSFIQDLAADLVLYQGTIQHMVSFSSIATLVFVKLNRDNYLLWRSQLESVMISQDLMKFVDGSGEAPPETIMRNGGNELNPEFATWRKTDQLVSSWIKATVSEAVLGQIIRTRSTREAWTVLEKLYGSPSPLRVMLLKKELMFIKKGNSDMVSYLQKIKMLVDSLDAVGCHTQNEDLVQIVLNGLPSKYESLVTSLVTSNSKMPNFAELYDILLNQETRLQLMKNDVAETPMEKQVTITTFNTI